MRHRIRIVLVLVAAALALSPVAPAQASSTFSGYYTNSYGTLYYEGFVPSSYRAGTALPLVVALHGCTQTTGDFAAGTRWSTKAESQGFLVVYPQQSYYQNSALCWNWSTWNDQFRGQYEPSQIAGIVGVVKSSYTVDPKRVFVTGISAGGAMSVIMAATYPDVFASASISAGCEYDGYPCGSSGGQSPTTSGNEAYSAMGGYARSVPVQVFQGTSDSVVPPVNGGQVISQWAQTDDRASDGIDNNNIDDVADATTSGTVPGGRAWTRYTYKDGAGAPVLEKTLVTGMGHAWSGGCSCGSYTDPSGPDATSLAWTWFAAHPKP
ncbi:MAG: phaZ1 [Frankiales bacterium]|nr:phaZ1 [Frankiales bacterium]